MASSQTSSNDSSATNDKGVKGSVEGRVYEKLSLLLLAKNGYEISKDNAKFRDFSIGREIGLGRDVKFDDNVFRYTEDDTNNFIFVQVKHIQRDHQIDSRDLSVEAARAKRGRGGGKSREFNLQKYFISYLSVREELKSATSEEYRNGKITYVAIFTNAGLDTEELLRKGFSLKEAPDDIINLFTLRAQEPKDFYQLSNISKELNEILMKSSDLHRMAKELVQYVVWKNHREKNIMKNDTSPMKHYHVPLAREVIRKSDQVENKFSKKQTKNEEYCEAQFRDEFLENDETGSKQELLNAVFEAIRELDESKKSFSDDQLKHLLKGIKWKIVSNFGETEETEDINLPSEWKTVKEEDITDFLKCLVLIVNQPRVNELQTHFLSSVQDTVVDRHYNTTLREIIHQLDITGPKLREIIEHDLGIYETTNFEEKWTSGHKIVEFIDEQKQQISVSFFVTAMTLIYENEVMQFGKFNESGKIEKCLDIFFSNSAKILGIKTPQTLLSSIKILQYLNSKNKYLAADGRIYTNSDILKSKENKDSVARAFESERIFLLVIEYRHTVNEQDVEEFYNKLYSTVIAKPNKKIIFIVSKVERNHLLEKFKNVFQNKDNFMLEYDIIDIKYFEPKEDPLKKEVIMFQGQNKRVSVCDITGIDRWNSYIHSLSEGTSEQGVIDGMTLVEILNNDEIEVGSKPAGTSSLEGAYAQMYEEIDVETLAIKLMSKENENDMYIISGIFEPSKQDKTDKIIKYLGLNNNKEMIQDQLGDIGSDSKIQVADGQFKHTDFQTLCHNYPMKRIFWISVQRENNVAKFILQEIYNPKFYLKRKFKNVIIKKDFKKLLIKDDLPEIFIFHCADDKRELYKSMELHDSELKQIKDICKIKIFSLKSDAEAAFKDFSKQNETIHLLEFKEKQFVWCDSHGSVKRLQRYFDYEKSETSLVDEDKLIRKIKGKKVVLFADDPGMGKTTTLIKLYETENESSSIIKSHWIIGIKLKDHLEAVRDLELKKDGLTVTDIVQFLSKIDSKLNNKLSKNLLAMALDKRKHFLKPLLLALDGFDEVLDVEDRILILLLIKFINNETAAKLWITTRCHFKTYLENELSTIAIEFVPMKGPEKFEYITTYLQHRLYLILNDRIFNMLFTNSNERQEIKSIPIYTDSFLNKMELTFKGNISRFIGTPLQLHLMLEGSAAHLKKWIENGTGQIPVFNYASNDVYEVYENFITKKYDVYFQKEGIRERVRKAQEKFIVDRYHKYFAVSKFVEVDLDQSFDFEQFRDIFLLVGVIKSQDSDLEFIHKTFEEFFAAKLFIDWIKKAPNTNKEEYLLKVILIKPDYQLVRTFMNLHLQNVTEQAIKGEVQNELAESLKKYGIIAEQLLNEEKSPLIDTIGTPLHIAVAEGNKAIACFLLNSLKGHSDSLKKFLFTPGKIEVHYGKLNVYYDTFEGTALHLACTRDDAETVRMLLDAAEGISKDTLQEFLQKFGRRRNALAVAVVYSHNVQTFKELLSRTDDKLDFILTPESAICFACIYENEEFIEFLFQEFKHDKHSLKQLLLHSDGFGNALCCVKSTTTVEKLVSAGKSMEDNNKTLKDMLLPEEGDLPLKAAVDRGQLAVVEKLLNVAKEIGDDTLKQLILKERYGKNALHVAAEKGPGDIISLLLETAADLDMEIFEKLVTAVDKKGMNAIQLMIDEGYESILVDSLKLFDESEPQDIREKVIGMYETALLKKQLCWDKRDLISAIKKNDIQEVKYILSRAKNAIVSPNVRLRCLLIAKLHWSESILHMACERGNTEIIKKVLSYAMSIDDRGATLKELLTTPCYGKTPFQVLNYGYTSEINQIVESLIFGAQNNNRMHAVNILKEIKEQLTEVRPPSVRLEPPSLRLNFFQRIFRIIRSPFRRIEL